MRHKPLRVSGGAGNTFRNCNGLEQAYVMILRIVYAGSVVSRVKEKVES